VNDIRKRNKKKYEKSGNSASDVNGGWWRTYMLEPHWKAGNVPEGREGIGGR
jgi:hypothetical protein